MWWSTGTGIKSAIMTGLMTASGYISSTVGNVTQPDSAVKTIENIYKFGPIIIWVAAILILLVYKLDKEYPQIMEELSKRED